VVDDEEVVRVVVARMIERLGFTTVHAHDGVEAVGVFRERHRDLRFVITDLSMPRMNGDEAIAEMRRVSSEVPIILMSGYPEKLATEHFAIANPSALLAKPLRLDVLRKTISQVLAEAPLRPLG
jgi:CheY-like chemotaxis protein